MHAGSALNVSHLQALRAVADHGSVSAAAAELYLTPSAVSQQLQTLAVNCGFDVVERHGRTVRLPRRGRALVALGDEVVARWTHGLRSLAKCETDARGVKTTFRVGALTSAYRAWLSPAVARIRATTGLDLELVEVAPDEACERLMDNALDVAVSVRIPRELPANLHRIPLYNDTFIPVSAPTVPSPQSSLSDWSKACWVLPEAGTYCHEIIAAHCSAVGFAPHAVARSNDWDVIQRMAVCLDAVALVPASSLVATLGVAVHHLAADQLPEWPIELITRADLSYRPEFAALHRIIAELAPR
ncbi:LysR family transcriptional regulator [Tsukamurella sputi]|nr:LysR family transcriptional regulator [Tsukamurella sputi]